MSKTYGYARVSSKEQHLDRQILRLQEYVEKDQIIVDKQSGATLERPGYQALKGQISMLIYYWLNCLEIYLHKKQIKNSEES